LIQLTLPQLEKRKGRIVLVGSKQANEYFNEKDKNFKKYSRATSLESGPLRYGELQSYMNSKVTSRD